MLSPICATKLVFTIVFNNVPYNDELTTDWGMSCFIKGTEKTILFDTGCNGKILLDNMEKLKIDPKEIDAIFLSHIHYDHVGGLWVILEKKSNVMLYIPKSSPTEFRKTIEEKNAKYTLVDKPIEICEGIYSSGELGDIELKEQSLIIDTKRGLIIITGCAHPGIVNIARSAYKLHDKNIYLILGGFHLIEYSEEDIKNIIQELKKIGVRKVGPSHCTGDRAIELFKQAWGRDFLDLGCGAVFELEY